MVRYDKETARTIDTQPCTGILLANLGTPDAPTPKALRRYLAEFLSDPRVIEKPRWFWLPVLYGVILNIRPRKAAKNYASVWTDAGSPLLKISRQQEAELQKILEVQCNTPVKVALAMRYGNPSVRTGMETLRRANAQRIVVLPLYPQYSATTTASTYDAVFDAVKTWRNTPEIHLLGAYYTEQAYIDALAASVREHWQSHGQAERLLFSFHGLPKTYIEAGDPYRSQCECTAQQVAAALSLQPEQWLTAFQSRFGPEEWLKPYTDHTLEEWGKQGVRSVDVISPGFSADCLETLEEMAIENRELFLEAGGERYHYIPCLNTRDDHMQMLANLVKKYIPGA
jgi:ferrochelatase